MITVKTQATIDFLNSLTAEEAVQRLEQIVRNVKSLEGHALVTTEWKNSADELARYVNYNGDEDEDYKNHLNEGQERKEHIAYHAHVVGGWDDLVWERFSK